MAMIDYGAVVIKNGRKTNNSMFSDMLSSVGWNDEGREYINPRDGMIYKTAFLNGNFFAFVGDSDFTLAFYKNYCRISWDSNDKYLYSDPRYYKSHNFSINGITYNIKKVCRGVYFCTLDYKDDHYKVVFGYGIDPNMDIWNEIKVRYLGKKNARKVDNIYKRWINE